MENQNKEQNSMELDSKVEKISIKEIKDSKEDEIVDKIMEKILQIK